jgi:hypothetical protein
MIGILLGLRIIAIVKNQSTRYIIREWFSRGELTALQFLSNIPSFTPRQLLGLGLIASFTALTFPLGVWLGSFSMDKSYPITNIITAILNLVTFPITLYSMSRILNELEFNPKVYSGISLIVVSKLIFIVGCWLMYRGNLNEL